MKVSKSAFLTCTAILLLFVAIAGGFVPSPLGSTAKVIASDLHENTISPKDIDMDLIRFVNGESSSLHMGCPSGGEGAASCSLRGSGFGASVSCSVTCGSGYYACCNALGCSCVGAGDGSSDNPAALKDPDS